MSLSLLGYIICVSQYTFFSHNNFSYLKGVEYVSIAEHFPRNRLDLWCRDGVNIYFCHIAYCVV